MRLKKLFVNFLQNSGYGRHGSSSFFEKVGKIRLKYLILPVCYVTMAMYLSEPVKHTRSKKQKGSKT